MASKLFYYDGEKASTRTLPGFLRALAWESRKRDLIIVGNGGRVLKLQEDEGPPPHPLDSGTRHNLRAVSVNPSNGSALIVGNTGTAVLLDPDEKFTTLNVPTFENLRSVSWHPNGVTAVIVGNNGTLLRYSGQSIELAEVGRANLRDISWRPNSNTALISSNCFAEEFIPSPNLFNYDADTGFAKSVNEGRADLISVDWKLTGDYALVVGYDVVWHNGLIGNFDGTALQQIDFDNKRVYPVAVAWNPSSSLAAIVTATSEVGAAEGIVFTWDQGSLKPIYHDPDFFFSDVTWIRDGSTLAALASSGTRAFNS